MKVSATSKPKTGEAAPYAGQSRSAGASPMGGVSPVQATFSEVVEDMEVRQLLAELDDLGSQLSRFPTSVLMGRYKELVRMVLERVRGNMQIRREFKWRRTERSMFLTIERTEGALEELEQALDREGDRIKVLSLIDEIKGCLISLLF